jgi:hypothetical protein
MNHNFENDLVNQNQDWSPDPSKLEGMLSKAHQQADQIHSRRRKSITALTLCLCIGAVYFTQPASIERPQAISNNTPISVSPEETIAAQPIESKAQESIEALAQTEYFSSEDFDFIEDDSSFPWDQLLAEY